MVCHKAVVQGQTILSRTAHQLRMFKKKQVDLSGYAGDHSIHNPFKPSKQDAEPAAILTLKNAVADIGTWMSQL